MILFVGVLSLAHQYKGTDYLIKAMKKISKERKKTKLIINGMGGWKKELVALTKSLKLEDNVIFVDKFNNEKEKVEYFRACDVLVLPSINKSEGFGIVSLEAMACGKPVIGSNVGGIPFVLGDVGMLTKPKDVNSLSSSILKVLNNEKLARRMGKASRKRVEKHFTIRKAAEKTEKVFESLI
jgi:glycosyltransferase involved in cell wall biosynthesis